jgi:protein involved in polysaccharide export with SLBB domain
VYAKGIRVDITAAITGYVGAIISTDMKLAVGDEVQVYIYQSRGGAATVENNAGDYSTAFNGHKVL